MGKRQGRKGHDKIRRDRRRERSISKIDSLELKAIDGSYVTIPKLKEFEVRVELSIENKIGFISLRRVLIYFHVRHKKFQCSMGIRPILFKRKQEKRRKGVLNSLASSYLGKATRNDKIGLRKTSMWWEQQWSDWEKYMDEAKELLEIHEIMNG